MLTNRMCDHNGMHASFADCTPIYRLLLRALLKGELHASDQTYLDSEAPEHSLAFLMRERQYVHPAEVELFPFDIIESALSQAGGAIFTHLYRDESAHGHRPYRIITSVLNPSESSRLILGFFGPEHIVSTPATMDRFARLAERFRTALKVASEISSAIPEEWGTGAAMLLTEKGSGEIIAFTNEFTRLIEEFDLGNDSEHLDRLFSSDSRLLEGRPIKLSNIESGGYGISCITVGTPASAKRHDANLLERLTEEVLAQATGIELTVNDSSKDTSVLKRVGANTESIRRSVQRISMLASFDTASKHEQNLYRELEQTIARLRPEAARKVKLVIAGFIDGVRVLAPADSIGSLYESILLAHIESSNSDLETTVRFDRRESDKGLLIHFDTPLPTEYIISEELPDQHRQYARGLADKLGLQLNTEVKAASNCLTTTLSVHENKRIRN